ncbi:MAG: glycosyltransferase family 4 protein [Acidimicrobiales bacterium]
MIRRRLRILVLSPDLPYPPSWGFGTRVYQLVRHLAEHHDVTLLCYARPDQESSAVALREVCADVRMVRRPAPGLIARRSGQLRSLLSTATFQAQELRSRGMQAALDELLGGAGFDVVQVESTYMGGFRFGTGAAVVLDEHNIEYELLQRMSGSERSGLRRAFNGLEHAKTRRVEQRMWQGLDACLLTSAREEAVVRTKAPGTVTAVVPNGVDPEYFAEGQAEAKPDTVVFTGLLTYRPNLDAARFLVEEVLPLVRAERPETVLTVVGHGHEADLRRLRQAGAVATGWVDDVRPYMAASAVATAPLRIGSGTRLKVVEALAMAKPLVSTRLGCEGLELVPGEHMLVADDPAGIALAIGRLLADPVLARRLGRAGRARAVERYSWATSARRLDDLYQEVAGRGARRPDSPVLAGPGGLL